MIKRKLVEAQRNHIISRLEENNKDIFEKKKSMLLASQNPKFTLLLFHMMRSHIKKPFYSLEPQFSQPQSQKTPSHRCTLVTKGEVVH
jgi:hypothetical protein